MIRYHVSVILPLYNGEKYILQALQSTVELEEVKEILIIDDGSTDRSLEICQQFAINQPKLTILQHTDKKNHGRSASRNLGIRNAKSDFIAFLDADDIYLPNRFEIEKNLFLKDATIEGVYGSTIAQFENEMAKELFYKRFNSEITTIKTKIEPSQLLQNLLFEAHGHFTTNAITIKKSIFEKSGYFDEQLYLGEDTHLWYRLAAVGNIVAGSIHKPIAIRRVHDTNSIHTNKKELDKQFSIMYHSFFQWAISNKKLKYDIKNLCFLGIYTFDTLKKNNTTEFQYLFQLLIRYPLYLFSSFVIRKLKQLIFN